MKFIQLLSFYPRVRKKLVKEYIFYFGKLLPFQYSYTDWLAEKLRPFRVNLKTYSQPNLCSDYISIKVEAIDPKKFIMVLKFLKFIKNLDYKTEIFDGDYYRVILFRVKDFLDVSHSHYNSRAEYYKIQKTREFLRYLQQNVFVSCFTDQYFKSFVTIPKLELYKCKKSKSWVTRILLLEELFDYQYPFKYPDLFETENNKLTKDQYLVRFENTDQQVILVGRDSSGTSSNVPSNIGRQGQSPSNFPTPRSGGRPSRPAISQKPYIYRTSPKGVDRGLGAGAGGGGNAQFHKKKTHKRFSTV